MNDLIKQMQSMGCKIDIGKFPLDGNIHRFDFHGDNDGWCIGYKNQTRKGDELIVAQFGSWKTAEKNQYQSSVILSREDKKSLESDIAKIQAKVEIERKIKQDEAAERAEKMWTKAQDNPNSEYLERKQIGQLNGAKTLMGTAGRELLIPLRDVDGKLFGVQRILPDGTKLFLEGQRKESCFHVIPFSDSILESDIIYVAEGFATASSIYAAIGKPVVVAFDSGNLLSVVTGIKSKFKDKAVIICGDDDRFTKRPDGEPYNPGREAADKSAKAVLGKTVFPKFAKDNGKLTDFNDLHLSEGLDAVKNQVMGIKPEFHTVSCLGYQDNVYYFISSDKPTVTSISSGSFSKLSLLDLMPLPYWQSTYPAKTDVNWDGAIDSLMRGCRAKGEFMPKNVRGAGVWQDNDRTVVNTGSNLWIDGEIKEYREFKSEYIYQTATKSFTQADDFATTAEMNKLAQAFEMLSWKKTHHPKLMLGFMMIAPICGSLDWRPHVWLTGPSGTGKSYVMKSVISKILGKNMLSVLGTTTEAGLRQRIRCDAKPVVFDELETDDEKSGDRVASVIELCRQASSETDAEVVKGTAHGKSLSFSVRFAAVVSSIRPNLQHEQDRNRFAILELTRNEKDNFSGEEGIYETFNRILKKDFAQRMFTRSVKKIDLILKNQDVIYKVIQAKHSGRLAQQYGIMIAGYFAALQDQVVTADEVNWALTSLFDLSKEVSETVTNGRDEDNLVNEILEAIVHTNEGMFKVAELVDKVLRPAKMLAQIGFVEKNYNEDLERFGLKVTKKGELAIYPNDREFRKLLRGTKWKFSAAQIVERVKDSELSTLKFLKIDRKCVKVPLPFSLVAAVADLNY